ncbi:MAG TPA: AIR synthase-related protein, partial [Mucilaginibacter sp.]|nr:AIR synthase-related protein [Mucilaginibacter sp.]
AMHQVVKQLIKHQIIQSAHDVSDGGLFVTLVESAMPGGFGFTISSDSSVRKDAFLFGEAQGRVVVSVSPENQERFIEMMATSEVEFSLLGEVSSGYLAVDDQSFGHINDLKLVYDNVLFAILGD